MLIRTSSNFGRSVSSADVRQLITGKWLGKSVISSKHPRGGLYHAIKFPLPSVLTKASLLPGNVQHSRSSPHCSLLRDSSVRFVSSQRNSPENNETGVGRINETVFPGLPALLGVSTHPLNHAKIEHAWVFGNHERNRDSIINRIEVIKYRTQGQNYKVDVYFDAKGCDQIQKEFPPSQNISIFHHHKHNFCCLTSYDPNSMKMILNRMLEAHQFKIGARETMTELARRLSNAD